MVNIKCVGCGGTHRNVPIQSPSQWAYTCPCGAHLFQFDGIIKYPSSIRDVLELRKIAPDLAKEYMVESHMHLEHYIGWSDYSDDEKTKAINQFKLVGIVSFSECTVSECKANSEEYRKKLENALQEDDYWHKIPEYAVASTFFQPLKVVRELREKCTPKKY